MQTSLANVEAVMIDGIWKKRGGRLLFQGIDQKKEQLQQSGMRIVCEIEPQEKVAKNADRISD
jgi:hypothetical protein